jgi:predicted aldo/keto reductase-like oxidoreductase
LEELVPLAKDLDIGIAAMKPFSAKTSKLITCLYEPSLSLLSDEPELKSFLGEDNFSMVKTALDFVFSQDVSVVVTGFKSNKEVETSVNAANNFNKLNFEEELPFLLNKKDCRDCGLCLPCPDKIDIAAILRFHKLFTGYGLKNWAKKLYNGLDFNATHCTKCGKCELKCPYNLPIITMLQKVQVDLQL